MTERTRNLAVGLTVLVGLVLLAVLIVVFAGLPEAFRRGTRVHMLFEQTYDIEPGDAVYLRGKNVGVVTDVFFTDGDPRKGVTISARIDADIRLPRNIQARVYTRGLMGKGYLTLLPGLPTTEEEQYFRPEEIITLRGEHDADAGLLPPKLIQAFEDFGALAKNLNDLIAPSEEPVPPAPASRPTATTQPLPPGLKGSVARLNRTLDAMHAFFARGETSLASAEELMRQLLLDAEEVSRLLHSLRQAAEKINQGDGTAGKLLNDPKLYDNLVRVSEELDGMVKDFRRLARTWETKGMGVQLK